MLITVADRRAVSAEVTVEMVETHLTRTGWELRTYPEWPKARSWKRGDASLLLSTDSEAAEVKRFVERLAAEEQRQPSEVLSDVVGYQVGLDRGRASVLRNSASARVVEAREVLAAAETALKAKPKKADRIAAVEAAQARIAQAEAELAAATRALVAATAAEARP